MSHTDDQPLWMITQALTRRVTAELHVPIGGEEASEESAVLWGVFVSKAKETITFDISEAEVAGLVLEEGTPYTAYFVVKNEAFSFRGTIAEISEEGAETDVRRHVVVNRDGGVTPVQRRNAFRTPFRNIQEVEVGLFESDDSGSKAKITETRVGTGSLDDASSLGLGILLDGHDASRFAVDGPLFVTFTVPGDDSPFTFLLNIRYANEYTETRFEDDKEVEEPKTRIGLAFAVWPDQVTYGRELSRFEQTKVEVQREHRRRMAG